MRKPLKVALGLIGVILAAGGVLTLDAHRRAQRSIAEHELRLSREIEQARSHPTCDALLRRNSPNPRRRASFDQSAEARWDSLGDYWKRLPFPARFEEDMLHELAELQESARECGVFGWSAYLQADNMVLKAWESALATAEQDRATLRRRFEALEALYAARPSLREFVASEKMIEKIELLRLWRQKADPTAFMQQPPCWRELFSWRILIAESLNHVDDFARLTDVLHGFPVACEHAEWESLYQQDVHYDREIPCRWKEEGPPAAAHGTRWAVARAATAVALFRLEKGRDPAGLSELVPLYLRAIPVTVPSGDWIEFKGGAVGSSQSKDPGSEPWSLFRR